MITRLRVAGKDGLDRPQKPLFAAVHVVFRSRLLNSTEKLIWYEHYALDHDPARGCWIGARSLAERLGVSQETVEGARRRLVKWGLLVKQTRGRGAVAASWYAVLPPDCAPRSKRPLPDTVAIHADRLDLHLERCGARRKEPSHDPF